jgi:BON domain
MKNRMAMMNNVGSNQLFRRTWPAAFLLSGLMAMPALTARAIAQDAAPQATDGQRTDGQIEMDVVHALDANPALTNDFITAGTVQGEVTLSGTSQSDANRTLAESIATKVSGVTKVVNNLKVGDPQQAAEQNGAQPQDQVAPPDQGQYQAQGDPQGQYPAQQYPAQDPNQYPAQPQPQPQPYGNGQQANGQAPPPNYPQNYQPQQQQGPEPPHVPVTLAAGTLIKLRTSEPLDSKKAKDGTPIEFTVVRDVYAAGVLAIPRGATIRGLVADVKRAGAVSGSPEVALQLSSLEMGGQSYPLAADPLEVKGPNKTGRTVNSAIGGALLGAIIGGAAGGGGGAAIGAGAGAVGGTAASAVSPGPRVWIPAEALMDFHLNGPVTVTPVSSREAMRLAANAPPPSQRPTLYRRGYYPYGYYPPPPPPPGYYYRPY